MAVLVGFALTGLGLLGIWHSFKLQRKGTLTIGTITKIKQVGKAPNVWVSFKTLNNKTIVFNAGGWGGIRSSLFYQVGNPIPVLYDPNNPNHAVIYSTEFMWLMPLAITGFGLLLIYYELTN